jgi:hypothetical protein
VRVREQAIVLPALAAAGAFFTFEEGLAAVQAVAADGLFALVDCVRLGRSAGGSALLGWRVGYGCIVKRNVESY